MFSQVYKILSNFDSKIAQILQVVTVFFLERGEEIESWLILTYLYGLMAEVFPHCYLSSLILAIFRVKWVVKLWLKLQTLGPSLFDGNSNPLNFFQAMFLFARVLPLVRILVILDHICGRKVPKSTQKGLFHECWISTQNFANF